MSAPSSLRIGPGRPYPLGATVEADGINFCLYSATAGLVELLLFDRYGQHEPTATIPLEAPAHRTHHYWHAHVAGLGHGQIYAFRTHGPYAPERGHRFNGHKLLLDPYSVSVAYGSNWDRSRAYGISDNTYAAMKSVALDLCRYDWEGDHPLQRPLGETIIYETHVRGLTAHPSAGAAQPGTYRALIGRIPYLRSLGVTAVELLPVQQFDPQEVERNNPLTGERLSNYWGYTPVAFQAPHADYAAENGPSRVADEFRDMVKALHRAGIEVILDVVFNHTAENDDLGPTISFRGLENPVYYMLRTDPRYYQDFAGCGNTVNTNHAVVRHLIRHALRHWVTEYHVDGFRFDLASIMSRNTRGEPVSDSPILWELESDPVLAGTKLIAEAWDAAGLYQLGSFGERWAEWNGRFRDDVRRFVRGDDGTVRDLAWRLTGSFDVFREKHRYVSHQSINYVTCHDGFTLADLVAYDRKHNEANGEGNRDGTDANHSWNCGVEGPTSDRHVLALRARQARNLITLLMVARGTPMLLGGDELGRTQHGNNNAYCQDNETSWYDWGLLEGNADLHRFVQQMIAFRRRHPTLTRPHTVDGRPYDHALSHDVTFHGIRLRDPDWAHHSHSLAVQFHGVDGDGDVYVIANAFWEPITFALPEDKRWRKVVDTVLPAPGDIVLDEAAPPVRAAHLEVQPRSTVVLVEDRR